MGTIILIRMPLRACKHPVGISFSYYPVQDSLHHQLVTLSKVIISNYYILKGKAEISID